MPYNIILGKCSHIWFHKEIDLKLELILSWNNSR